MPTALPAEAEAPVLKVGALECYRNDRRLFADLDFTLGPGQVLLIEGPNGCGKTSLLRILCGIRLQDGGSVSWGGTPIEELGPEYHAELAYLGHHDGIKLDLTTWENLTIARQLGRASTASMESILVRLKLQGHTDVFAGRLSAGQRRRLALARLLATENRLWILDEPLTSLDRQGIELFLELVREFVASGGMVVMTSHHDLDLRGVDVQRLILGSK